MSIGKILSMHKKGEIETDEAEKEIMNMSCVSVEDIAKIDVFRCQRTGVPEAILADGKKTKDLIRIIKTYTKAKKRVLVTRVSKKQYKKIVKKIGEENIESGRYKTTILIHGDGTDEKYQEKQEYGGRVAVITAGTADIPVAEEACMTAREMGCETYEIHDVGVAGYQRFLIEADKLISFNPDSVIVAAGREGTLPTIVAGIVDAPVIGLPVSTGYGAGAKGKAALWAMLQSCSVITVVNIDAGFVAGAYAARIANRAEKARRIRQNSKDPKASCEK